MIYRLFSAFLLFIFSSQPLIILAQAPDGTPLEQVKDELGVTLWHEAGYDGSGIKIGIIDVGFAGIQTLTQTAIFPEGTDLTAIQNAYSNHGTLVYEVLATIAPQADYYLFQLNFSGKNLPEAIDWMLASGVQVVNYSASTLDIPLDGTSYQAQQMGRLADANIVVVTAVGNHGTGFFTATYQDNNRDGWHDFEGGAVSLWASPMLTEQFGETHLRWRDVYTSAQIDLDLYIFAANGAVLYASTQLQQGREADWSYEDAFYPTTAGSPIYIAVRAKLTNTIPANTQFYIYTDDTRIGLASTTGSLTAPADSPKVLAVGALEADNSLWQRSSRGPTWDERIKPDLVAPTRLLITSLDYPFVGTSASTPLVAGVAALARTAYPTLSEAEIRQWLITNAQDLGINGADNNYGYGRVWLPPPPSE